jgi:chorismate mutase / prephenate dehydratase
MTREASERHTFDNDSVVDLRQLIDQINVQLVDLLSERAQIAQAIGRLKLAVCRPVGQPWREREVLERIAAHNTGPFTSDHLRRIFIEIISACTALEQPVRIAYLGPQHTYSYEAALSRFGGSAQFEPQPSIAGVFQAVENARTDFGVVPVENTSEGCRPYS